MPQTGDIIQEKYIFPEHDHRRLYIWAICETCGEARWVRKLKNGQPAHRHCSKTSCRRTFLKGRRNLYRDGRVFDKQSGYVRVWVAPNDFFAPMRTSNGYVLEHRLVMAKYLRRCLQSWEPVHHKGIRYNDIRNKSDNLEDNLELTSTIGEHSLNHSKGYSDGYRRGYEDGKTKAIAEWLMLHWISKSTDDVGTYEFLISQVEGVKGFR